METEPSKGLFQPTRNVTVEKFALDDERTQRESDKGFLLTTPNTTYSWFVTVVCGHVAKQKDVF